MSIPAISRQKMHTEEAVWIHRADQFVACRWLRERAFSPATLNRIGEEMQG